MKNFKTIGQLIFIILSILYCSNTAASTYEGQISELLMGIPYKTTVIIKVDGSPSQNGCHSNPSYHYAFDGSTDTGKIILSSVLTAYTTQKVVKFYGAGSNSCTQFGGIEDLNQFLLQ